MRFIMRFCANQPLARLPERQPGLSGCGGRSLRLFLAAILLLVCVPAVRAAAGNVQQHALQAVYDDGALYLTARLEVRLGEEVQDALKKGVPLHFVSSARLVRKRWYWYDADVVARYRIARLSYVPLTRQWQVRDVESDTEQTDWHRAFAGSLYLRFSSLEEALAAVQTVTDWKIATLPAEELDGSRYVAFDFRLDLSGLPKPFQLGAGSGDAWDVAYQARAWPEHKISADLTAGQNAGVVAEPVEMRSRSAGTALHRSRSAAGGAVGIPPPLTAVTPEPLPGKKPAPQQPDSPQSEPSPLPASVATP